MVKFHANTPAIARVPSSRNTASHHYWRFARISARQKSALYPPFALKHLFDPSTDSSLEIYKEREVKRTRTDLSPFNRMMDNLDNSNLSGKNRRDNR